MSNYSEKLRQERREELTLRACGDMEHKPDILAFNLQHLDNALESVEDALDNLDDDDVSGALSDARAAKNSLKKAVESYDDSGPKRDSSSRYSAETIAFNLGASKSAFSHVNDAINALEGGNVSKASSELNDAQEILENAVENYDDKDYDDVVVRRFTRPFPDSAPAPDPGMSGETVNLEGETVEFASCSAARRRITKARRSLRKAIRAYAKCTTNNRVVVVESPPPPAPAPAPMP